MFRIRRLTQPLTNKVAQQLIFTPIQPNHITLFTLFFALLTTLAFAYWLLVPGAFLVIVTGVLDGVDGALARVRRQTTGFGAFLDSALDRYGEVLILAGILVGGPSIWACYGYSIDFWLLGFIALVGALMTSYTRARAEVTGLNYDIGLIGRSERLLIIVVGAFLKQMGWALLIFAILSNITAIQRIFFTWRMLR